MADESDGSLMWKTAPYGFKPAGRKKILIAVMSEDKESAARIVQQIRPYRHGAKLDTTGAEPNVWSLKAVFNNSIDIEDDDTTPQFPDRILALEQCARDLECGDFTHPVDGVFRARIHRVSRSLPEDATDTAFATLVVIEDNEEGVDAASIQAAIRGSAIRLGEQTSFTTQLEGDGWNGSVEDLKEFLAELEGLMRAPGRCADDIDAKVRSIVNAADSVLKARDETQREDSRRLAEGPAPGTRVALERLIDRVHGANDEQNGGRPRAIRYLVRRATDIYAIAADVKQPVSALLELNAQRIEDPFAIPAGEYRVYERWP
jgi:prophage DNA circulation protein